MAIAAKTRKLLRGSASAIALVGAFASWSCDRAETEVVPPGSAQAKTGSTPISADRLAPGELAPGDQVVFGFRAPKLLRVEAVFPKTAHLRGTAAPEDVANYVRTRVAVQHVEIAATRTVFPRAKIRGDTSNKLYRFEVIPDRSETRLVIRDITPPPTVRGIDEEERWKRAGMSPNGKLLNQQQLE